MRGGTRASVTVLLLFASACGTGVPRSRDDATSATTSPRPGSAVTAAPAATAQPTAAPVDTDAGVTGTLRLTLFDDNGRHPAEIPVDVSGPGGTTRVASVAGGIVSFTGPAGDYSAVVVSGCHATVLVHGGGNARFRLVGNRPTTGELRAVWEHRYGPYPHVRSSVANHWPVGENVDLSFSVTDRCAEKVGTPAPNAGFPTFVYETSSNVRVVGTPVQRSDGQGRAKVTVRCSAAGAAKLVLHDRDNPEDRFDLVKESETYGGEPRCI